MRLTDTFYRSPTLWATDRHLKAQMIVRIFTTFPTFRMNETPHSNLLSGRTLNSPSLISSEEEKRESHPSPSPPRVRRISRYARIIFRIWTCQKFRYLAAGINEIGVWRIFKIVRFLEVERQEFPKWGIRKYTSTPPQQEKVPIGYRLYVAWKSN